MVREEPYQWVMHSHWLSMYMTLYHAFFILLTVDTFFAQNFIQMTVLGNIFNIITISLNAVDNVCLGCRVQIQGNPNS
jgi:hypothetical protein